MSLNMSIRGRLAEDARLIIAPSNPETELLYMTIATTLYGYTDKKDGNQWKEVTEFYQVQLSFKKGMADRWIKNNMLAKGHMLDIKNLMMVQGEPTLHNGKHYHNNTFYLLPNYSMYDNIEFLHYPHAVSSNSSQAAS
jgi:hypothetical protein